MTDAPSERGTWITLARVVKTQGRRGELATQVLTDIPGRLPALRELWLADRTGQRRRFTLTRTWPHKQWLVLALAEITDLNAAEPWIGAEVQVPQAQSAAAPAGTYLHGDLLGCQVWDGERLLGTLTAIEPVAGAADLFHIATDGGKELLVPFAAGYVVRIALNERAIRLVLPEGLREINDAV